MYTISLSCLNLLSLTRTQVFPSQMLWYIKAWYNSANSEFDKYWGQANVAPSSTLSVPRSYQTAVDTSFGVVTT